MNCFRRSRTLPLLAALTALLLASRPFSVNAQTKNPGSQSARSQRHEAPPKPQDTINAWTVGLAGGLVEGAPIRLAAEIARVVDDGDKMHVLPVVTRGPTENVNSLLYLRGIDAAIINSDALEE